MGSLCSSEKSTITKNITLKNDSIPKKSSVKTHKPQESILNSINNNFDIRRAVIPINHNMKCFNCANVFQNESSLLEHYTVCVNNNYNEEIRIPNTYIPKEILQENPFAPDTLNDYIDWTLSKYNDSGLNIWIQEKIIKLSTSDIKKIGKYSFTKIKQSAFYEKRVWFYEYINNNIYDKSGDHMTLVISRDNILRESFNQFRTTPSLNIIKGVQIHFIDEVAQDVGGVFREWYTMLFNEIFSTKYNLFYEVKNKYGPVSMFIPMTESSNLLDGTELEYYNFIGKIIAKGIFDKTLIKVNLNLILIKFLLDEKISLEDIKYLDLQIFQSLESILFTSIDEDLMMPFSWNIVDEKGGLKEIELCENGLNILITNDNKIEYVRKVVELITYSSIKAKIDTFREGFYSVINKNLMRIFNADELDFIISGQIEIDILDWRNNTIYKGHYNTNHKVSQCISNIIDN